MRLIDADRLLDKRMQGKYYHLPNGDVAIPIIDIEHAPTVEVERTGHWIEHEWAEEVEGLLVSNYECSSCHSWKREDSDFCPDCGARMKKCVE